MKPYKNFIKPFFRNIFPEPKIIISDRMTKDLVCELMDFGNIPYRRKMRLSADTKRKLYIIPSNREAAVLSEEEEYDLRPGYGNKRTFTIYSIPTAIENIILNVPLVLPFKIESAYNNMQTRYDEARQTLTTLPEVDFKSLPQYIMVEVGMDCHMEIVDVMSFMRYLSKGHPLRRNDFIQILENLIQGPVRTVFEEYTSGLITSEMKNTNTEGIYSLNTLLQNNTRKNEIQELIGKIKRTINILTEKYGLRIDERRFNIRLIEMEDAEGKHAHDITNSLSTQINNMNQTVFQKLDQSLRRLDDLRIQRDSRDNIERRRNYVREFVLALLNNHDTLQLLLANPALANELLLRANLGEDAHREAEIFISNLSQANDTLI